MLPEPEKVWVSRMVGHSSVTKKTEREKEDKVKNIRSSKRKEEGRALRASGERLQWIGLGRISTLARESAGGAGFFFFLFLVFAQVRVALPYPIQPVE